MTAAASLRGWVPIRVYRDPSDEWAVEWCRLGAERFVDPFYAQTIERVQSRPLNRAFRLRTSLDMLGPAFDGADVPRPAGLIFHVSRCGSTLIAQMLAALRQSVVISEAEPVDDVLGAARRGLPVTDEWRIERLQWLVGAIGLSVPGDMGRFVLKLEAWHALDLALIRRAFPGVPAVAVYRDPVEVLVSQLREPAWMTVSSHSEALLGITTEEALALPRETYFARVIGRVFHALAEHDDPLCRLVNYAELPQIARETIPRWFGIELTYEDRRRLADAELRDAKGPQQEFAADAAAKQQAASAAVRAAAEAEVRPLYDALEARRLLQRTSSPR